MASIIGDGSGTVTINFSDLASAALFKVTGELYDQFIKSVPLLDLLEKKSRVVTDGGEYIKYDVRYGEADSIIPFSKFDVIEVGQINDRLPCILNWKNIAGAVKVADEDLLVTKSSDIGARLDLLAESVDFVMRGFRKKMNAWIWQDGSDYSGKVPLGMDAWVSTTPTTGVLGQISRATYIWWRNSAIDATAEGASKWINGGISGTIKDLPLLLYSDLSYGNEYPDVIFSHPEVRSWYERIIPDHFRVTVPGEGAEFNYGYETLAYKGIPWYVDKNCYFTSTDGRMYFLRLDDFKFYVSQEWQFTPTGFVSLKPSGVIGSVNFILLRCNLACTKPTNQGVIFNYTGYN